MGLDQPRSQGLSSSLPALGGGKKRDPGNEVGLGFSVRIVYGTAVFIKIVF